MIGTFAQVGTVLLLNTMFIPTGSLSLSIVPSSSRSFRRMKTPLTIALATDSRSLQRQQSFFQGRGDQQNMPISRMDNFGGNLNNELSSREKILQKTNFSVLSRATRMGILEDSPSIHLSREEEELFDLLTHVTSSFETTTTLRVAGGWVRDKLLATKTFARQPQTGSGDKVDRLTSKWAPGSKGRKGTSIIYPSKTNDASEYNTNSLVNEKIQPLDIDIALDDMLGREFADKLNEYLLQNGQERVSVGMVMKNPEKSKHLETATMKVGKFWIDFVNLRAEEYVENSRIPDLMRIGTPEEDAFRRDLTINALFYNINKREVEDFTGRGVEDLKKGTIATPLHPLTTLLDDPLRVLRSIRFAARLRFSMDESLRKAAKNVKVREALAAKVSRERIGGEVDLMLRSPDPVGAMRLLVNLDLARTVFPVDKEDVLSLAFRNGDTVFDEGLNLLSTTHDYLCDCKLSPPIWCKIKSALSANAFSEVNEVMLNDDEESRRILWYSAFLKPVKDYYATAAELSGEPQPSRRQGKKAHRSLVMKLMLDELKRPSRDAEGVEKIMSAADEFTALINNGASEIATSILLNGIFVKANLHQGDENRLYCGMQKLRNEVLEEVVIDSDSFEDEVWKEAMEYRLKCAQVLRQVKSLWRASLILSLSEQLTALNFDLAIEEDVIGQSHEEVRLGIIAQYDAFAASLLQLGLIGIWTQKPIINGDEMKKSHILPQIPKGPIFREIMTTQEEWMTLNPGGRKENLIQYMREKFPDFT